MTDRYKSIFCTIITLTVVWLVIIWLCLPQDNNFEQWTSSSYISSFINRGTGSLRNIKQGHETSLSSPSLVKYLQAKHRFISPLDTLFYEFNLHSKDSSNSSSDLSKDEHIKVTSKLGFIDNLTDQYVKSEGTRLFAFNLLVSNRIGLYRLLPDTRNAKCHSKSLANAPDTSNLGLTPETNFQASIIICYYNEAPSALLRTIFTVLKRSPHHLLKEIIVIDDFSNQEYDYIKIKPFIDSKLVTLTRTSKREGLIRARLFGAKKATGNVLVFLDSHVEANVGWLEPLLKAVKEKSTTIACPMIDLINAETLIYTSSPMVKGGLNWALNFKWDSVPSAQLKTYDDFVKPIRSPTMAGGLYAIDRNFFKQLGEYDPGMELWGGENIELSLRAWMCGGQILILPCSRLGHIFRKKRPYGPEPYQPDSLLINSHRTARVWLDEYINEFYAANPDARYLVSGDVSQRLELRHKLGCRNFSWFLENIYPDLKRQLVDTNHPTEKVEGKPKLFNIGSLREDRRFNRRDMAEFARFTNHRLQRQASQRYSSKRYMRDSLTQHNSSINSDKFNFQTGLTNSQQKFAYLPKMISQFQIQSLGSNLCIESKGGFLAKGFTRLILNHCASVRRNNNGEILISNSTILDQLWTETELHDYRLGDNQCLDLSKNLPLLRKCHNMGSSQVWTRDNQSGGVSIYNSGRGLCLGVERIQAGEPIIVTICDRPSNGIKTVAKSKSGDSKRPKSARGKFISPELEPLEPCQKWGLLFVRNATAPTSTK